MKIAEMNVYTPDKNNYAFVELITDEGVAGWGASYSTKEQVLGAFEWLRKFVVGENPLEIERVTEKLHQITFWVGRGGAITHAISAINIALWDMAGKTLGQHVSVMLGGRLASPFLPTARRCSSLGGFAATNHAHEGAGFSRHEAGLGTLRPAEPGGG